MMYYLAFTSQLLSTMTTTGWIVFCNERLTPYSDVLHVFFSMFSGLYSFPDEGEDERFPESLEPRSTRTKNCRKENICVSIYEILTLNGEI